MSTLCRKCIHKDICFTREYLEEDEEEAMKYCAEYIDEDNIIRFSPNDNFISHRQERAAMLSEEFNHWASVGAYSDFIKVVAHELSWRMIMRIVHKLQRKRDVQ